MSPLKRIIRKAMGSQSGTLSAFIPSAGRSMPGSGHTQQYFFISGHPRSGTNWLSALVNLHPHIYCHGEFHFHIMRQAMDGFTSLPWYLANHEPVRSEAESAFGDLVRRCLGAEARKKPGAWVLGDHTPRPMRRFLPEGKHLLIRRDGRDVLVSWTYHLVRTGKPEVIPEPARSMLAAALRPSELGPEGFRRVAATLLTNPEWVRHFARSWSTHVTRDEHTAGEWMRAAQAKPEAGCAVLPLRYEDLHADIAHWRSRVYEFLGVDPSIAAPISAQSKTAPGFGREDPGSFYRKGEVGDWVNHLTAHAAVWFTEEAGAALDLLGYPRERSPQSGAARGSDARGVAASARST
jgi:hypothetical protein